MAVVDPRNQLPVADPHPPPHHDPLREFASEPSPPREHLIEFEPGWRGPEDSKRLTERAPPLGVVAAPSVSMATSRRSRGRWFIGAVMLGAGLVVGFASGVALVTQSGGDQNVLVRSQPPPPQPVADRPANDPMAPLAPATNDPRRTTETHAATPEPEPPIAGRRASGKSAPGKPVEVIPSPMTALYVQSRPAGAEVYLDDQLASTTPFQLSEIAPGRYTIRIDMQGYRPWSAPVSIESGARTQISAVLER